MAWCPGSGRPLGHNAQTYRLPGEKVVCPECGVQYLLDDEEMAELRVISARTGEILACGVIWD